MISEVSADGTPAAISKAQAKRARKAARRTQSRRRLSRDREKQAIDRYVKTRHVQTSQGPTPRADFETYSAPRWNLSDELDRTDWIASRASLNDRTNKKRSSEPSGNNEPTGPVARDRAGLIRGTPTRTSTAGRECAPKVERNRT